MKNLQAKARTLAFIDFDGVFCDSLTECFVSSWIAYHRFFREDNPGTVSLADRMLYDVYRPFIRRGGDYVILQHCISEGISLEKQEDFDCLEAELGETADMFHDLFYQARRELLAADKDFWISINHVFPGLTEAAKSWADSTNCYVLSTKEAPFIRQILFNKDIDWPLERIICSGKRRKIDIIKEVLAETGADGGLLFEDQVDHLYRIDDSRVRGFLASWGYVKPDWLHQKDFPVIDQAEMVRLVNEVM
ncbi:HAD family hydrolase [Marispirochaeta sp.]|uniref:HAD family hydrolase n=1 Tax=Marispirochaeta sp. TaxID=2038653 RepID=UPI0029C7881F|nr:HAD family hydrolase [Marispirochaeta sp.]